MNAIDMLVNSLQGSLETLKWTLADFSDADMLVRPCPGANHATWQIGHLANAETNIVAMIAPAAVIKLPDGWGERFNPKTAAIDDVGKLATKAEVLGQLEKARAASIAWVKTLSEADLDKPGPERFRKMAPTVGALAGLLTGHVMMHLGQCQVIRRKLGKPVLF